MSVQSRVFQFFLFVGVLYLKAGFAIAEASPLHQRSLEMDFPECLREMRAAAVAAQGFDFIMGNPMARLPGAMRMGGALHISYEENVESIYFQFIPGKLKLLKQKLTAAEVNAVLNSLRAEIYEDIRKAGVDVIQVKMIFKGVSLTLRRGSLSEEDLQEMESRVNASLVKLLRRRFPHALNLLERLQLSSPQLIKTGLGHTEGESLLASRYAKPGRVRFEDLQEDILSDFEELLQRSAQAVNDLLSAPRLAHLLVVDESKPLSIDRKLFDGLRKSASQEDFHAWLVSERKPPGPVTMEEDEDLTALAEQLWSLWKMMKLFIPAPDLRDEDIQAYDPERVRELSLRYVEAPVVLVADLVGAGGRVMEELFSSLVSTYYELKASSFASESERKSWLLNHLAALSTPQSVEWIHRQLDEAIAQTTESAGSALIDFWVTGDEVHFLLRDSIADQVRRSLSASIRLTEVDRSPSGEVDLVASLQLSLAADLGEAIQKWLAERLEPYFGDVLMIAKVHWDPNGGRSEFDLQIIVIDSSPGLEHLLLRSVEDDLASWLKETFALENLHRRLKIRFVMN